LEQEKESILPEKLLAEAKSSFPSYGEEGDY
jgi:hypothetical protein